MTLDDLPIILAVQERDIDLLLLEQMHASPAFVVWWCKQIHLEGAQFDGAWHSISSAEGETDVLLRVCIGSDRVGILIENKVGASEQHEQDIRYHRRGAQGIQDGWFDRYTTCMCAPKTYLDALPAESRYIDRISYEQIAGWFADQADAHSAWRKRVMDEAVTHSRRGYMKVVSDAVTAFHRDYYAHLCRTHPNIRMNPPGDRGGQGYWVILWMDGWPKNVRLNHKMKRGGGTVELGFTGHSQEDIVRAAGEDLPMDIIPITTGQYGSLAIRVAPLDFAAPLEPQISAVDEAFDAMERLVPYATLFTSE
jgi:hypothetical protein